MKTVDLFVIGGGINGAGIARDAAGRGLSVMLAEKGDYASGTSSASTKLIHGGLRYLENFDFGLVRESLRERTILMKAAPYLVRPQRFLLPIMSGQSRRGWRIWTGLKLYDLLAGSALPKSRRISVREASRKPRLMRAGLIGLHSYFDCQTDDARLVIATLIDARDKGADIGNYREVEKIIQRPNGYEVTFREAGTCHQVMARFVVNATGPWANQVLDLCRNFEPPQRPLRLVRGAHLLLAMPKPFDPDAYLLQNDDGRVCFVVPWEVSGHHFLILGTTDQPHQGDPGAAVCSPEERDYLLDCYNRYFAHNHAPLGPEQVLWSWAGVRPLVDDGSSDPSKVSRDFELSVTANTANNVPGQTTAPEAPKGGFITVYGGKLTTYRHLAEKVMDRIQVLGAHLSAPWTANAPLTGGDLSIEELEQMARNGPGTVPLETRLRWAHAYGSRITMFFEQLTGLGGGSGGPGEEIAPGIYEIELYYATEIEEAKTADDFLIRRSKQALVLGEAEQNAIRNWFIDKGFKA